MADETKDLIEKNIESRVDADFHQLKNALHEAAVKYLPSDFGSVYDTRPQLKGESYGLFNEFIKKIEPVAKKHFKEKREKEFSEILTNLGSYLEMINR